MNDASIREYYLKLLAKYSLLPTFILILLLSVTSITYDKYVAKESLANTLQKNSSLADQIIENFNHSTGIIAKSSFSAIALKFSDFTGYRSVVVPWISDDKNIQGLVMFDQEHRPVLTWPSDLSNHTDISKIKAIAGIQIGENSKLIFSHDIFDNTEKLGSLAFITDSNALGLGQLSLRLSDSENCTVLQSSPSLYVCAGEAAANQKLMFSLITILISVLGLLVVFFFSLTRLASFLAKPVNTLHQGLRRIKEGKTVNWQTMFDEDSEPVFRPMGEHFSKTVAKVKELNSNLEYKTKLSDMAKKLAHDIRSPLSALNIVANAQGPQAESAKPLMLSAIKRINDISIELLKTAKSELHGPKDTEVTDIPKALKEIIMEKGLQTLHKIRFKNETDNALVFINESDFKCSISNLINNAIEASPVNQEISIQLKSISGLSSIEIEDRGSGIPPHVMASLGKAPITNGKEDSASGSGIGVYNASKLFHGAQGSLKFDSIVGRGTKVVINLPTVESPSSLAHHSSH